MSYKISKTPPITEESTRSNAKKWLGIIRYGESGIVIQPQDDSEFRVEQIINNPSLLKEYLGPYYRKYLLIYVPVGSNNIIEAICGAIRSEAGKRNIELKNNTGLEEICNIIGSRGYEIGIFLARISAQLLSDQFQPFFELDYIIGKTRNLSVVMFSETDVTRPRFDILADKCSLLYSHIHVYPLYGLNDCMQFLKYLENLWKFRLDKQLKMEIIRLCGGYLWLIEHFARYFRDNPGKSIQDVCNDDLLIKKLRVIWGKFNTSEKDLIRNIIKHKRPASATEEFRFLEKFGLVTENSITIPLLNLILQKEYESKKLTLKEYSIFFEDREITSEFTVSERRILELLLKHKGEIMPKEKLAEAVWKSRWRDKYSDWAMDRLIYRVRNKLKTLGANPNSVKSLKRKGVMLE